MGKIKKIVNRLAANYSTRDPFLLAKALNIPITYCALGDTLGYTITYKRIPVIVLNKDIEEQIAPFVCAHELGHAVMHRNINTPWLKQHTFFSIDKYERQANIFAVELLLSDEYIREYNQINFYNLARSFGVPSGLEELKDIDRINFI